MSCPDNLLIGYRKGVLSLEDGARLDAHLAQCPSCRLSLQVGADFDAVLQTLPGDDLIAARFARNLGPKFVKESRAQPALGWHLAWVAAALLAVALTTGLAAAAHLGAWPFAAPRRELPAQLNRAEARARPARVVAEAAPSVSPALPAPEPQAELIAPEPSRRAPSAAELFAQANARRRAGDPGDARRLYRELQQRYPRSPEVEVSRVSLGRVELELGAARAALEQFERYLSPRARGPLAEEALFGKASALERLGRASAESRTWQQLLATFPGSLYAERARLRLGVLRAPAAPAREPERKSMP
jgi:TolA-binding protein